MSFERSLQERILQDPPSHQRGRLSVGVLMGEVDEYGVWDGECDALVDRVDEKLRVPVACIAKVFTAALLVQEAERQRIALSSDVASMLGLKAGRECDTLARISLRQLLDHTHGLDGSRLTVVPRLSGGWIDSRALCKELANGPAIHEPGAWYSYGSIGSWLAAAILERVCDRTYEELLTERILDKIGLLRADDEPRTGGVCPATGGELALTARHFLAFLKAHIAARRACDPARRSAHRLDVMPGTPVAMPGWCLERGAGVGWKYFGAGWFGYDGVSRVGSLRVRLRFEDRIGIVVLAEGKGAGIALARLFGRAYPELCPASLARNLHGDVRPDASVARACAGEYVNRSRSVLVRAGEGSSLQLTLRYLGGQIEKLGEEASLNPYLGRLYVPDAKARELFPVVEFVGVGEHATHLWDGSQLLRRV